jgi:hypothetical protein
LKIRRRVARRAPTVVAVPPHYVPREIADGFEPLPASWRHSRSISSRALSWGLGQLIATVIVLDRISPEVDGQVPTAAHPRHLAGQSLCADL